MLIPLLVLLGPALGAQDPDLVALQVARAQAALDTGQREAAAEEAGRGLTQGPEDWRAWTMWHRTLTRLDAETQLRQEAALLVGSDSGWHAWMGTAWQAEERQRLPVSDPGQPETALVVAALAVEQRQPQAALEALAGHDSVDAQGLRVRALSLQSDDRATVQAARQLAAAWPGRVDLLTPICRVDARGAATVRREAVSRASVALSGDDPLALYRAHTLLAACEQPALAQAASARLVAIQEPYALGTHAPWGGAMVRDLGRVLAMQREPTVPEGTPPAVAQRVLVSAARELRERGRGDESLDVWRQAMALCPPSPALALEAGEVEADRGDPAAALALARSARAALALAAVGPEQLSAHTRQLAWSWRLEAQVLRAVPGLARQERVEPASALQAAALAASTSGRSQDLVLWGELLETAGATRAALQAYGRAAAQGQRGLETRLGRLYDGPATAEAVVAAWREALDQDPRSRAVEEDRGARVPVRTLATTAGPLRIGESDGEWLVLNFWASWCGPCQMELPELAALAASIESEGLPVRIVAVSVDDRRGDYEGWIADRRTAGLVLAWDPDLGRALHLRSIPTTLLVDPQGLVQEVRRGYRPGDGERLLDELRPHLAPATEE